MCFHVLLGRGDQLHVVVCTRCTLQDKATALMRAAVEGHTDVVQVLLSRQDVDINTRDEVCPSQWK